MARTLDFVVFGASGYTGAFVVEQLLRLNESDPGIRWALSGRDNVKLQKSLEMAIKNTSIQPVAKIPIIICDVSQHDSLVKMAEQATVVFNCVGPYRFFGEAVVKACIEGGAHHLDISGEPQYLEMMQLKYHETARSKGVYVIGACGFDSIPAEVGIMYLKQSNPEIQLNEVECFINLQGGKKGMSAHYGTWQSAIYGFAHRGELVNLRRSLFPVKLPRPKYRQASRGNVSYHHELDGWIIPFPGSDRSVVMRSQYYLHQEEKQHPVQFMPYFYVGSLWKTILVCFMGIVFGLMSSFKWSRSLLERHPRLFSGGVFSHEGPTREEINANRFTMHFEGKGWLKKKGDQSFMGDAPNERVLAVLHGPDPGYVSCAICLVQCGLIILRENKLLPPKGGVFAPGAAFARTSLVNQLAENGFNFVTKEK